MEFDALVVKESPGLCRCCLSEGCYKDLGTEYTWMNDTEVYADMLFECFDISITQHNDGPNGPNRLICEVCITRLRDACNFKKQVLNTEKKFIDMIGRREFKPQMLIYQAQVKNENQVGVIPDGEEVEYLEDDVQFGDDDPKESTDVEEPSMSEDITVSSLPVKGKRGRPRKNAKAKTEKAKVARVEEKKPVKVKESAVEDLVLGVDEELNKQKALRKHQNELIKLICIILENSTAVPFRWRLSNYACFFCESPFEQITKLKAHTKEEHDKAKPNNVLKQEVHRGRIKVEITNLTCRMCLVELKNLDEFLIHASEAHELRFNRDSVTDIYTFKLTDDDLSCYECGKHFKFFATLLIHVYKYHSKSSLYLCEICGRGFAGRANVDSHIKTVHIGKEKLSHCKKTVGDPKSKGPSKKNLGIKCPKCPEVFASKYRRQAHLATAHNEKKYQFKCDQCQLQFTTKSKLVYHKSCVHLKEKHVTCSVCGFQVFNKSMLKVHMVCHDDSRPFQCDICKKTFQRRKTLELHRRIHTNDKRYACKQCGKAYVQYTSLNLHMKVHHSTNANSWS